LSAFDAETIVYEDGYVPSFLPSSPPSFILAISSVLPIFPSSHLLIFPSPFLSSISSDLPISLPIFHFFHSFRSSDLLPSYLPFLPFLPSFLHAFLRLPPTFHPPSCPFRCRTYAAFFKECPGLSKEKIGEWLGEPPPPLGKSPVNWDVLQVFAASFTDSFVKKGIEECLRSYLGCFKIPGEAAKVRDC
jgi:hypothetical protein